VVKSFVAFLVELKLHRGHKTTDDMKGKAPFVWFALDKKVADGYAYYHTDSTITTINYSPKKSVDVGKSERRLKITELLNEIMGKADKSKIDMGKMKPVFMGLRKKFGNTAHTLDHFWHDSKEFATFVELAGFDSIMVKEEGYKTIGVLRKYIK